jgi:hypothetical protein
MARSFHSSQGWLGSWDIGYFGSWDIRMAVLSRIGPIVMLGALQLTHSQVGTIKPTTVLVK